MTFNAGRWWSRATHVDKTSRTRLLLSFYLAVWHLRSHLCLSHPLGYLFTAWKCQNVRRHTKWKYTSFSIYICYACHLPRGKAGARPVSNFPHLGGKKVFFFSSLSQSLLLNISFVSFLWKIWLRVPLRKREVLLLGTLCCLALHTAPFACNQRSAPSVFTFPVTARGRTRSAGLSLWQRRDQRSGMKDTRGTVQVLLPG